MRQLFARKAESGRLSRRWTLSAVLTFATLLTVGGCVTKTNDDHVAIVDGNRVAYQVLGAGKPVVVMIAGMGDGMNSFQDVAAELAEVSIV